MIPLQVELKNFLAYRSPEPIRLAGIHLACLTGPNGAGKSSLLDAITWALWGKARVDSPDKLIHQGQTEMYVQLDFEQEGTRYRVIRKRSSRGRGSSELHLYALVDGKLNPLSEGSIPETQRRIIELLRLDYETFTYSAFLKQGEADAFTAAPPRTRKQILADILGLDQWEIFEAAARDQMNAIGVQIKQIAYDLERIAGELAQEPPLQAEAEAAQQAQQQAQAELEEAERLLKAVESAPADLRRAQNELAGLERRLREHQQDRDDLERDIAQQEASLKAAEAIAAAAADIEAGYAALQSAREADDALRKRLLRLRDFDERRRQLERQLSDARARLESDLSACEARIAELEPNAAFQPEALAEAQAEEAALRGQETERDHLRERQKSLAEERDRLRGGLDKMETEGKNARKRLTDLQAAQSPVCPLCGQPLDEDQRRQLIVQVEAEITQRRAEYAAAQNRIRELDEQIRELDGRIKALDQALKRLPALSRRVGELQRQAETALNAAHRLDAAHAEALELRQALEGEAYAEEVRQQLAALEAERAAVGYDAGSHDAARAQLETYRDYETRYQQLQVVREGLPRQREALDRAYDRLQRLQRTLADETNERERLEAEIARLSALASECQRRQQEANRLRTIEAQARERLTIARQKLNALAELRRRQAEQQAQQAQLRHREGLYQELRLAFGKKGVPAMIIEAVIPELEASANRLLARMTDGRMHLTFTTQRDTASGDGVIETLDIQIADELGTRSYDLYSGGEAFRINFAIRVALSQLLARRAGAHLRTLFIDEGFGTQDDDGRNKLVEAITAIQDEFDLILVITHMDDLRDSFPVHLVVQKTPEGSRVTLR